MASQVELRDKNGAAIDSSNPLPVSATLIVGDIELGAVELKNGTTDQRAVVDPNGSLQVTQLDSAGAAILGVTTGAAVITDANGSIQQYLRGLIKRWADALGAGTAAAALRTTLASDDPAVAALGATNGAKVITDANGTIQQYLRGLISQWIANTLTFASAAHAASVTFTPANTSHAGGDCVGAAGNFASLGLSGKPVMITGASLLINTATAQVTTWRLHLYNVTPPSATADDGPWDLPSGDQASYLGYIDLGTAADMGSTQWVEVNGINKQVLLSGSGLFGYLTNGTTATLLAVAHIVTLHTVEL